MAEPLRIIQGGLLPEDQERENMIQDLIKVMEDVHNRPLHERRQAFAQMSDLIAQRPAYVVRKMEREQFGRSLSE